MEGGSGGLVNLRSQLGETRRQLAGGGALDTVQRGPQRAQPALDLGPLLPVARLHLFRQRVFHQVPAGSLKLFQDPLAAVGDLFAQGSKSSQVVGRQGRCGRHSRRSLALPRLVPGVLFGSRTGDGPFLDLGQQPVGRIQALGELGGRTH